MQSVDDTMRHRHGGPTIAEIGAAMGSSTGTVSYHLGRVRTTGNGWPLTNGMGSQELLDAIYSDPQSRLLQFLPQGSVVHPCDG